MYAPGNAETADAMDEASFSVALVDTSKPNIARVYDHLLGGKDNFAADREEAARLLSIYPEMPKRAAENRLFLARAVSWLAGRGIRQFLDIGSGLPTAQNTHQVAQRVNPSCRVVYVDNDPVVVVHGRALLAGNGVAAVQGDARDLASILTSPALQSLIDLRQPVAIILAMILHFLDADTVTQLMATFGEWLAPGSYVVLSVGCGDEETGGRLTREYKAGTLYNHTPEQIAGFFDGLELVGPGLVDAREWEPNANTVQPAQYRDGRILAGVGKKVGVLMARQLWVPKTYATWADSLRGAGRFHPVSGGWKAGHGGMIFGLWA